LIQDVTTGEWKMIKTIILPMRLAAEPPRSEDKSLFASWHTAFGLLRFRA
jgi:hypothetical protein